MKKFLAILAVLFIYSTPSFATTQAFVVFDSPKYLDDENIGANASWSSVRVCQNASEHCQIVYASSFEEAYTIAGKHWNEVQFFAESGYHKPGIWAVYARPSGLRVPILLEKNIYNEKIFADCESASDCSLVYANNLDEALRLAVKKAEVDQMTGHCRIYVTKKETVAVVEIKGKEVMLSLRPMEEKYNDTACVAEIINLGGGKSSIKISSPRK